MSERALHHGLGARFAEALEQILLQGTGVDADAHRTAVILGRFYDFLHALRGADVAGIDAQARGAGIGRLERALIVEMDIGDDRNA